MEREVIGVDIGGSGVRIARIQLGVRGERHRVVSDPVRPSVTSVSELVEAISGVGRTGAVGVSVAGFVDSGGSVTTSRANPWLEGPLQSQLGQALQVPVSVVNDGEAHLIASLNHLQRNDQPVLALVAGSSLAVAMTDEDGTVRRPRRDRNWELGELRLNTRAAQKEVWWALGRRGFEELEQRDGTGPATLQFGARLGAFAADLAGVFTPRVVVLSGGLVAGHSPGLIEAARSEFTSRAPWWVDADLVASGYGHATGVVGAAVSTMGVGR